MNDDLIDYRYKRARDDCIPLSKVVGNKLRPHYGELTTKDLQLLLVGQKIKLDCGHQCTVGHNFTNTMIIISEGGGRIKTMCHECGY